VLVTGGSSGLEKSIGIYLNQRVLRFMVLQKGGHFLIFTDFELLELDCLEIQKGIQSAISGLLPKNW